MEFDAMKTIPVKPFGLPGFGTLGAVMVLMLYWPDTEVHAYVDPGSGSMFLQFLLGGMAGLGLVLRVTWKSLRNKFGRAGSQPTDKP
jgi:hypothetical protein